MNKQLTIEDLNKIRNKKHIATSYSDTSKPIAGMTQRSTGRYIGWYAFITGKPVYFGKSKADCNDWLKMNGCEPVK